MNGQIIVMKKHYLVILKSIILMLSLTIMASTQAFAHGGGLDKKGGHNCSQKSKDKGLCSGYHYHKPNKNL